MRLASYSRIDYIELMVIVLYKTVIHYKDLV